MNLPFILYSTTSHNELSDLGCTVYRSFNRVVTLDKIICQSGEDPQQVLFHDLLLRLRNGKTTISDCKELLKCTPTKIADVLDFACAVHLYPTVEAIVEYNISQLQDLNRPIATIILKSSIQATMPLKLHQKMQEG